MPVHHAKNAVIHYHSQCLFSPKKQRSPWSLVGKHLLDDLDSPMRHTPSRGNPHTSSSRLHTPSRTPEKDALLQNSSYLSSLNPASSVLSTSPQQGLCLHSSSTNSTRGALDIPSNCGGILPDDYFDAAIREQAYSHEHNIAALDLSVGDFATKDHQQTSEDFNNSRFSSSAGGVVTRHAALSSSGSCEALAGVRPRTVGGAGSTVASRMREVDCHKGAYMNVDI
jgi:hypothetical protein